ncbi:MAG: sigma-54-dependent Fis family transcriptional regulator [Myxococcales bacterium]|nr:sigma-54-dependent Fis family transcriptional regulator [Myxococcales bacterium]MBK7196034.1 sigma-54-dependent Fis family transcriptional regulator [Myxococcales bacterium]MBP6843970.1 sigma-54-dependent Fis family transcriptional regulator [Kofleriaceae bacterium]
MVSRVMLVEDDRDEGELLRGLLTRRGHGAVLFDRPEAALAALADGEWDAVITDVRMAGLSGIELCEQVRAAHPEVPVVMITGQADVTTAVAALRAGAWDFVTKPVNADAVELAVTRAVEHRRARGEVRRLRQALAAVRPVAGIIGDSAPIRAVSELVNRVADGDAMVLITGESGTGKELVARAIHDLGPRQAEPFVAVNCGAVPANLLESELFGHVKGAFTDARRDRPGLFVQAGAGTIFLDELGEMPPEMQVKLLRVLQERTVRPVGGDDEVPFVARVVCATNRDLETEVEEGRFRQDLYYRVNVVTLEVPPLRARGSDVLLLAHHFLRRIGERTGKAVTSISPEAARKLLDYDWPGNVRELENGIERAVALAQVSEIGVDDLPTKIRDHHSARLVITGDDPAELVTMAEMERRYVRRVLDACGGNKTQAAKVLGMDRRSLYRRLEEPIAEA